jgi:hypothetical protein
MAETVASLAISLANALINRVRAMAAVDDAAKKLLEIVKSLCYTLEEARERGTFRSSASSTYQYISTVHSKLQDLELWITNYHNAGKSRGMLRRMRDYFFAGSNLEELQGLSQDLDHAFKCLNLSLSLEISAGVKELVQQQSSIAQQVVGIIQQHSGKADDHELAEIIAKKTNFAIDSVKHELATGIQDLRGDVGYIREKVDKLCQLLEANMNVTAQGTAPPDDVAHCLELAPFSKSEWVNERHGQYDSDKKNSQNCSYSVVYMQF